MKGKCLYNLSEYQGKVVWVEFEAGYNVSCDYEEGPSTEIDRLADQFQNGRYRVEKNELIFCEDESISVFQFNSLISGIYEWTE